MIKIEKEIELTPEELARELWEMNSEQQAKFFNEFGIIVDSNGGRGIMQLDYISMENGLYPFGAKVINHLHDVLEEK